ncbi:hypothetical protein FM036_45045, partial [Nostoc sp. HG1]|nr:hypothetical protein [Nostoc sp. HG1]
MRSSLTQFKAEPAPEPLARLAAVLYRPKNIPYISYNAKTATHIHYDVEKVFASFLALDGDVLYTMFTWYTGCRQRLPQLFPTAFKSDGSSGDEPDFIAFTKCIHSAAGP